MGGHPYRTFSWYFEIAGQISADHDRALHAIAKNNKPFFYKIVSEVIIFLRSLT